MVPGVFGPIVTAGVALGTAAVVVANPVVAPRADVRIAAADDSAGSSRGSAAVDMLDEDFIKAIGPAPAVPNDPVAVLKDLVGVLLADAAYLGRAAILHAFVAGTRVVPEPELTASSRPYIAVGPAGPEPAVVPGDLAPVVTRAVTAIIADAGDVTDPRALVAAYAAGAALAEDFGAPADALRVAHTIREAVETDLHEVFDIASTAAASVTSEVSRFRPVVDDAVRTVTRPLADLPLGDLAADAEARITTLTATVLRPSGHSAPGPAETDDRSGPRRAEARPLPVPRPVPSAAVPNRETPQAAPDVVAGGKLSAAQRSGKARAGREAGKRTGS